MLVNLLLLRGNIGRDGRGHLAGARPFQRAGPAHRRHHREARAGAARQAREPVRLRAAAREGHEHGRGLPRACSTARSRPSSASAAISPRAIPEQTARRGRLAATAPDRAGRDQAQPQPPDARQGRLPAALPRPDRGGHAGRAGRSRSSMEDTLQPHPRLDRASASRPASTCCRETAIVAGIAKATLPPNPKRALGRVGRRLRRDPRPDRGDLSRPVPRLQRADVPARRLLQAATRRASGSGRPKAARPSSPSPSA